MIGIQSRRFLPKSSIRGIRGLSVIRSQIFEADGRASTSSRLKYSVLVIEAEERFWGINNFIFTYGFQFLGGIAVFDCEKVNFDAEKGCEFADCVIPIRSSLRDMWL